MAADSLPYRDLDILGTREDAHNAGGALLAELARSLATRREEAGELDKAAAEAAVKAALADEDFQLDQLASPSQNLDEVAVKLAYALRAGSWAMQGGGNYADTSLALLGLALSDVLLLREAEAQRRYRLGERAA